MFKGEAKQKKKEAKVKQKEAAQRKRKEDAAARTMQEEIRQRLKNFKREEFEQDIDESADIDHIKDMCRYLLSELCLTPRAPRVKYIRMRANDDNPPQCEIRCGWDPTKKALFDCQELTIKELDGRFGLDGKLLTDQPFLEAVDFDQAPWFKQRDEMGQPLILFPHGDPPHDERDDPAYFNLCVSAGLSYILHLGVSCRGKLFSQLRSVSAPPERPKEDEDSDDENEPRFS